MGQYRPLGNGKLNYQNQLLLTEKIEELLEY